MTFTDTAAQISQGSNGRESVLHILQSSRNGATPSDGFVSYPLHSLSLKLNLYLRVSLFPLNGLTFQHRIVAANPYLGYL